MSYYSRIFRFRASFLLIFAFILLFVLSLLRAIFQSIGDIDSELRGAFALEIFRDVFRYANWINLIIFLVTIFEWSWLVRNTGRVNIWMTGRFHAFLMILIVVMYSPMFFLPWYASHKGMELIEKRWIVTHASALRVEDTQSSHWKTASFWRPFTSDRIRACLQFQPDQFCIGEIDQGLSEDLVMPMRCTDGRQVQAEVQQFSSDYLHGQMVPKAARFQFDDGMIIMGGRFNNHISATTPSCFRDEWRAEREAR